MTYEELIYEIKRHITTCQAAAARSRAESQGGGGNEAFLEAHRVTHDEAEKIYRLVVNYEAAKQREVS